MPCIQNNLGNAYSDLPTGDRAANLQRASPATVKPCASVPLKRHPSTMLRPRTTWALPTPTCLRATGPPICSRPSPVTVKPCASVPLKRHPSTTPRPRTTWATPIVIYPRVTGPPICSRPSLVTAKPCASAPLRQRPWPTPRPRTTWAPPTGTSPAGDRAANLQQAIACYREALRFRTPETAPLDYATTQNNLGAAYANLPTGDRAANLQRPSPATGKPCASAPLRRIPELTA